MVSAVNTSDQNGAATMPARASVAVTEVAGERPVACCWTEDKRRDTERLGTPGQSKRRRPDRYHRYCVVTVTNAVAGVPFPNGITRTDATREPGLSYPWTV
jgi:hypothetical protein